MDREEKRSLQREVNIDEALEEIIHLLPELDDATKLVHERLSRLESRAVTNP